jgi:hypothetical protein
MAEHGTLTSKLVSIISESRCQRRLIFTPMSPTRRARVASGTGLSIFPVADPHAKFGPEDVRAALDAEDRASARDFLNPGRKRKTLN